MAHPNLKDSIEGHNAKLRRLTEHYGSADPTANIPAETNRLKGEGEEDPIGFGADTSAPRARADRASRGKRTTAANPVSTYAKGGAVAARARGGRTKHGKGQTHVNVIVAPQGAGAGAVPPPVLPIGGPPPGSGMPPPMPPHPPMGMPPGGPMAGGPPPGLPMAPGAPGGLPPGIMPPRAKGGRVKHSDEAEDKDLIHRTLKAEGLVRSDKPVKMPVEGETPARARGGKITSIHDMDAGSMSGEGRLQKIELQKHQGKMKSQAV